ncbi:hypothetical protein RRG08_018777 [Elysia crispata]|uniref:Uncharacterized protein n=1 Tax=Elysia crispata TaxID=231223 RepID=A0AAE1AQW0_9GAST|nr:hypothetical protein RRG08_018777 [Elysia crispata]
MVDKLLEAEKPSLVRSTARNVWIRNYTRADRILETLCLYCLGLVPQIKSSFGPRSTSGFGLNGFCVSASRGADTSDLTHLESVEESHKSKDSHLTSTGWPQQRSNNTAR